MKPETDPLKKLCVQLFLFQTWFQERTGFKPEGNNSKIYGQSFCDGKLIIIRDVNRTIETR